MMPSPSFFSSLGLSRRTDIEGREAIDDPTEAKVGLLILGVSLG
jgi:hypothetical protein